MSTYITYRLYGEGSHSRTLYAGEHKQDALQSLYAPHRDVLDTTGLRILEAWVYGKMRQRYRVSVVDGEYDLLEWSES